MLRIPLAACVFALSFPLAALAQNTMSGPAPQNLPPNQTTSPSGSMPANGMSSMTCDQMMAKAQSMSGSASSSRMTMAHSEISMAQMAQAKNDDAGCTMHAMKAMDAVK
jgi:hypothetical protein